MPYTHARPATPSFTGLGMEGYSFEPLRERDLDIYYIESVKGHDTFMISKRITRTYYVLRGNGHFTVDRRRYDVCSGMLVEIPPKIEYSYSGRMVLLGFARPRWFRGNDTHTRWNPDVTSRDSSSLPGREPWPSRLARVRVAGKSPVGAFLRLNGWLWRHLPPGVSRCGPLLRYGNVVHALARVYGVRRQTPSTYFVRNRAQLELIRRLMEQRDKGEILRVAVLGCSFGAEAYSIAREIRSALPESNLVLNAMDVSPHAVEFARRGVYPLASSEPTSAEIFERMTAAEKADFFQMDGETAVVKAWIREGIIWAVGDVSEPDTTEKLGLQDLVVANNFLCHMAPSEAERCLRNIARLVSPYGYLIVSGIDLDVRTKVARALGWTPVDELLEAVHDGDPCLRSHYPWHYSGLETMDKGRQDWRIRYAAAFQILPTETDLRTDSTPMEQSVAGSRQ
ncbi:MAG TPA: CheR family methyltransferase [Terriglobales bacterium]|nr:CheR family methyltransferase [Terriglobales bacterium]